MEGFTQGRPGILSMYLPSRLLKMSIELCQQDGLYYSTTDTFTVDTNPRSSCSPFVGSAFTDTSPEVHLIDEDEASDCSGEYNVSEIPVEPTNDAPTVGRRGTNQLCLLEWYLDVPVKHTTEIPPSTALVEVRPRLP